MFKLQIQENIPLATLTTFRIGGPARYVIDIEEEGALQAAIEWAREQKLPYVILGGGSNVLMPDEGFDGCVIRIKTKGMAIDGVRVRAAAGEDLFALVRFAGAHGLGGLENLAGVPGSVGGAVRGNAGAFGTEIKDILVEVRVLNIVSGDERVMTNAECDFDYRHSFFKKHPEFLVLEAVFELAPKESGAIEEQIQHTLAQRHKRHIQDIKSAGSFFTNPIVETDLREQFEREKNTTARGGRVPAGWLMERAGLRGAREGDAVASSYHTNYFLNEGSASAGDVRALAERAKQSVREHFHVELEEEVMVVRPL